MTLETVLWTLGAYAALLAVLLLGYWAYGVYSDRRHAREMVRAFDLFVARLEARRQSPNDETTQRVDAQVERNDARLDAYYSGATDSARRNLAARESYLRAKASGRHG